MPIAYLAIFLLMLPLGAAAETSQPIVGAEPGINRPFVDPEYGDWVDTFESPGREVYDYRREILAAADPQPGMDIADIGAGTGLFTRLFADAVGPSGQVFAVDIAADFVRTIERIAARQGLENIVGIVNSQGDSGLAPESVDLVFICDTYHHFEQPSAIMRSIYQALRPGGRLILVDFERIPGVSPPWIMRHVRAGKEVFAREIQAVGFALDDEVDIMQQNYLLRFHKPARATEEADMSIEQVLFDAASRDNTTDWRLITDTVMGGISDGALRQERIDGRDCLRLTGQVRLENNGGFVQMATDLGPSGRLDASAFRGLVLDVYGNAEEYKVHLRTNATVLPWQSYRADFAAKREWQRIEIPFSAFRPYRLVAALDLSRLRRLGLVAIGRRFEADLCLARLGLYQ